MSDRQAKIQIDGPYDPDNPDDADSSVSKRSRAIDPVNLYSVKEARADNRADINSAHVPGQDPDEAILGGFLGREEFNFDGIATGNRLAGGNTGEGFSGRNGLPAHPLSALKEFALRLESLVLHNQGWGYKLVDEQRGRTLDPGGADRDGFIVQKVTWERTAGEKYELQYNLEGSRAKGTSVGNPAENTRGSVISNGKSNWITDPGNIIEGSVPKYIPYGVDKHPVYGGQQRRGWTLINPDVPDAAFTLGQPDKMRIERSVDVDIKEIALGDPGDNIGLPTSAPKVNVFIEGSITPEDTIHRGDITNYTEARQRLNEIANYIPNTWVGQDETITIREGFTDRQFTGQFKNYSTVWEYGQDTRLKYTIELIQGEGLTS